MDKNENFKGKKSFMKTKLVTKRWDETAEVFTTKMHKFVRLFEMTCLHRHKKNIPLITLLLLRPAHISSFFFLIICFTPWMILTFTHHKRYKAEVKMEGQFLVRQIYDDEITYNIVGAAVEVLSKSIYTVTNKTI